MKPGGKEHPVDRTIHDGETVTLGGATLTGHLTAGHTRGTTTWTMPATEAGKTYQVVFFSSLRSPAVPTAPVIDEFNHSFAAVNPFVDPSGCRLEADMEEAMFKAVVAEQQKAAKSQR